MFDQTPKYRQPYHEIGGPDGLLANLTPFTNSCENMRGDWVLRSHPTKSNINCRVFRIYSYGTCIAEYWPTLDGGTKTYTENTFSVTTARQHSLIRTWLGRNHNSNPHVVIDTHASFGQHSLVAV